MEDKSNPSEATSEPMLSQTTDVISEPTEPTEASTNPADSTTPPPLPPATTVPEPIKPKKRGLKALMIAITAVAVLGAGAFAYFGIIVPNQPENVVKTALANLLSADSANVKGSAKLNWSNFSVSPSFNAEAAEDGGAALGVQANLGGVDLSFEAKQTENDAYLKLAGLSGLGDSWEDALAVYGFDDAQISAVGDLISSVDDKWIAINDVVDDAQNNLPSLEPEALSAAFGERQIISSATKVSEDTVEGRTSSHFLVSFNKDELKAGIDALNADGLDGEAKTKIKEAIDQLNLNDVNLWVYNDTKEFAKFVHSGSLGSSEADGSYELELIFASFNQTPSIVPPAETINGFELWLDLQNSLQLDQLYQQTLDQIPADSIQVF